MTEPTQMRTIGLQAPADLIDDVERLAKANERTLSAEVRIALRAHLEVQERAA